MTKIIVIKGGEGSGFYGHAGRPGLVGGSRSVGEDEVWFPTYNPTLVPGESPYGAEIAESLKKHSTTGVTTGRDEGASYFLDWELSKIMTTDSMLDWSTMDEDERAKVKDAIVTEISKETGVKYETVNQLVKQWAYTSNGTKMGALSFQEAVAEEFGTELSDFQKTQIGWIRDKYGNWHKDYDIEYGKAWDHYDDERVKAIKKVSILEDRGETDTERYRGLQAVAGWNSMDIHKAATSDAWWEASKSVYNESTAIPIASRAEERAIARAMYDITQRQLENYGYSPDDYVKLYRGFGSQGGKGWQARDKPAYYGNTIESWSVSPMEAANFGKVTISIAVPRSTVFCTARTGLGCMSEGEYVIFGNLDYHEVYVEQGNMGDESLPLWIQEQDDFMNAENMLDAM